MVKTTFFNSFDEFMSKQAWEPGGGNVIYVCLHQKSVRV